ncbi:LPXTG cell wall anchor domain-containing protein, partial [Ligilactobacillus sp. LYQ139]|uniref:LPXTG cell wall anchor domain-containing protein n=1 Tax=Ligilactobacillus sp. LYQ139 TaxID=3378800 RepID=UPI0038527F2C
GEGGEEPGNAKLVNAETGSSTPAWGFDKDVVNEFDPVSVNNNGAETNAVGRVPFPIYQNQGDLTSALAIRGLSQEQISSLIAAMMLTERGTYKGDYTPNKGASLDQQNASYNYQVQAVLDVIVGQVDPHQEAFIKQHFTTFQQKLYNAALADANVSVGDMTTAYLVAPGSNNRLSKLQLNTQTNTTAQFELNPHYLGAPVKVTQILPANYQVIDTATNQPVSELVTGQTYYVKTSAAVAQATVAMKYAKDAFNFFDTNCKPVIVAEKVVTSYAITPREAFEVPFYYNENGDYIGSLQTQNGYPVVEVTGPNGDRNVVAFRHMLDYNYAHMSRNTSYEGLMVSTPIMEDLTLQVFADMPTQSSSSSKPAGLSSSSSGASLTANKSSNVTTVSSSKRSIVAGPVQTSQRQVINAPTGMQHSVRTFRSHKHQQLPDTGDHQAKGTALFGIVLIGLGLGFAELWRIKRIH